MGSGAIARNLTLEMTLTDSPRLSVRIMTGAPQDDPRGTYNRFEVTGDDAMVERFFAWWPSAGMAIMAETLAAGHPFYLADDGDGAGAGGNGRAIGEYLTWRDETFAEVERVEPALAVAALPLPTAKCLERSACEGARKTRKESAVFFAEDTDSCPQRQRRTLQYRHLKLAALRASKDRNQDHRR